MAKKTNIFGEQEQARGMSQAKLEEKQNALQRQERTTLSLSITKKDKEKLQTYAYTHGMTLAGAIHLLIENHL